MIRCPECGHQWKDKARTKGGKARAKNLTKEQRSEIAKKAAAGRWDKVKKKS